MKIVMTGGGSGGHLYPILAIADAIEEIVKKEHLVEPKVWFVASESYDKGLLYQHGLRGKVIQTGKRRLYHERSALTTTWAFGSSVLNCTDNSITFIKSGGERIGSATRPATL